MANTNAPFGLLPVRHLFGMTPRITEYTIADGYSGASLFYGDPIVATGTGKNIGIATAGSSGVITGVFMGCRYVNALGDTINSKYWPTGTAIKSGTTAIAEVCDDPFAVFAIRSGATGIVEANIRLMADLVSGSGSTTSGTSGWTCGTVASSENQLKILGLSGEPNPGGAPNVYGAYAVVEVLINNHEFNTLSMTEI